MADSYRLRLSDRWLISIIHIVSQCQEAYKRLDHTDPLPLHHRAQDNYEPGTGDWMPMSPEWTDWLAGDLRCLWLHGIPGAGKTVLMSHLIEQIRESCNTDAQPKDALVYYYCYYGHEQDESKPFLKWLLSRLCREADCVPACVYNMSTQGAEPPITGLLDALAQILASFDTAYVAIDAIDESHCREKLLRTIHSLVTEEKFKKLQLIASSRDYDDIEKSMLVCATSCSMDNEAVAQDIREYVHSALQSNARFAKWPPDLLQEVEKAVSAGAQGM